MNEKDVFGKIIVTRKPDSRLIVTWSACEWQYIYSTLPFVYTKGSVLEG